MTAAQPDGGSVDAGDPPGAETLAAAAVVDVLRRRSLTVAVAESLTGGMVMAALTSVPGASAVVRGGVVPYATDLKATLLDVDPTLLARSGPVDPDVALAMARGVAGHCGSDLGLATTGVAGPDPQGGEPPGTVYVAGHRRSPRADVVLPLRLPGDRAAVRHATVAAALMLLRELSEPPDP